MLEEAFKKHPNHFSFGVLLVELAQQERDFDKAAARLDQLQQQFGDTVDVRSARARLLGVKEGKECLPKLAELTQGLDAFSTGEQVQFYRQLARICLQFGDSQEGLRYGQEAAKLIPKQSAAADVPIGSGPSGKGCADRTAAGGGDREAEEAGATSLRLGPRRPDSPSGGERRDTGCRRAETGCCHPAA